MTKASAISAAASHILGNQPGAPRRAKSPQLTAEEFFSQNEVHLRQRNAELVQMAAKRRPQRADDRERAAGPVPGYILAKRGTQGRGGHYHERKRGIKPAPRGALGGDSVSSKAVVIDRTAETAADSLVHLVKGSPVLSPRSRPNERSRLMPWTKRSNAEQCVDPMAAPQAHKHKALLASGWKLVQGGHAPVQRWVSPFRPIKTVVGLDAAYNAAVAMPPHAGGIGPCNSTATQIIQVKQVC